MGGRPTRGDTIVAIATPSGEGGIGVLRLSGPESWAIAAALCSPEVLARRPRQALLRAFHDAEGVVLDRGLVLYFPAPRSYTGEDVVELQAHGSPVLLDVLQRRCTDLGARMAGPGEFSERAFLNERLDLAQAEAVADLIHARSEAQARAAIASLEGAFSTAVGQLREQFLAALALAEAGLDFSEEELGSAHQEALGDALMGLVAGLEALQRRTQSGVQLSRGARVVLLGRPNVGKSSLLNALSQRDSAIVTAIPGTTRDVLREEIRLAGMLVEFLDTAGLRETQDPVEAEGVRRSREVVAGAQWILLLADASVGWQPADAEILGGLDPARCAVLWNKVDLVSSCPHPDLPVAQLTVSAQTGAGLDDLLAYLRQVLLPDTDGQAFSARQRHLSALAVAAAALQEGLTLWTDDGPEELLAQALREGSYALGQITGAFGVEEVLGEIFSRFCIGK